MTKIRYQKIIIFAIILFTFLASIYFYSRLPDQIPSHWNAAGEVNGYMGKFWGVFLVPILMLGISLLFLFLPRIDNLYKGSIDSFQNYYELLIIAILLFMAFMQSIILLWSLGITISIIKTLPLAVAFLLFVVGVVCEHSKRNSFVGIRTPWTLMNETVWNNTHQLAGKIFKILAVIAIVGIFFGRYSIYFILIPTLIGVIAMIVYSYFNYKKVVGK